MAYTKQATFDLASLFVQPDTSTQEWQWLGYIDRYEVKMKVRVQVVYAPKEPAPIATLTGSADDLKEARDKLPTGTVATFTVGGASGEAEIRWVSQDTFELWEVSSW